MTLFTGCEKPIELDEEEKTPDKYDITGVWNLYAWFSVDCPDCTNLPFEFTEGQMILGTEDYNLTIYYTYNNQPDSVIEMGKFYYSSGFFISWYSESNLYLGDISFHPTNGESWTVLYRTGRPPDEYNQVFFRNYRLKDDNSLILLHWYRETGDK
jgi:hypothetical protein